MERGECSNFELLWVLLSDEVHVATSRRKLEKLFQAILLVVRHCILVKEKEFQLFLREIAEVNFIVREISESVTAAETATDAHDLVVRLFFRSKSARSERKGDCDDSKETSSN